MVPEMRAGTAGKQSGRGPLSSATLKATVDAGWGLLGRLALHLLQGCHHFLVHHVDRLEGSYHHLELDDAAIAQGNHIDAINPDAINISFMALPEGHKAKPEFMEMSTMGYNDLLEIDSSRKQVGNAFSPRHRALNVGILSALSKSFVIFLLGRYLRKRVHYAPLQENEKAAKLQVPSFPSAISSVSATTSP